MSPAAADSRPPPLLQTNLIALKNLAIVVAGGSGTRMGAAVPKQFLPLCGKPVLMHTVEAFASVPGMRVVVVLPESQIGTWEALCRQHGFCAPAEVVAGGASRHQSVRNGLAMWSGEELIGVHDGVRPLVSAAFIESVYADASRFGTSIPVLPSVESVRLVGSDGASRSVDRSSVMMVQTPQVFRSSILLDAYRQPESPLFTDDASVVEANGGEIHLSEGLRGNIKLTTPADMLMAEALMRKA